MLTKQAHNIIARVIRELPVTAENRAMVTREFASVLKADNPRFNKAIFDEACGVLREQQRRTLAELVAEDASKRKK